MLVTWVVTNVATVVVTTGVITYGEDITRRAIVPAAAVSSSLPALLPAPTLNQYTLNSATSIDLLQRFLTGAVGAVREYIYLPIAVVISLSHLYHGVDPPSSLVAKAPTDSPNSAPFRQR